MCQVGLDATTGVHVVVGKCLVYPYSFFRESPKGSNGCLVPCWDPEWIRVDRERTNPEFVPVKIPYGVITHPGVSLNDLIENILDTTYISPHLYRRLVDARSHSAGTTCYNGLRLCLLSKCEVVGVPPMYYSHQSDFLIRTWLFPLMSISIHVHDCN